MSRIDGVSDLMQALGKIGKSDGALETSIRKWTEYVRGEAVDLCPVDTGALQQSITSDVEHNGDNIDGIVYTNKEYAPCVELGIGQAPQPYLYPALNNNQQRILKGIKDDMAAELKGG